MSRQRSQTFGLHEDLSRSETIEGGSDRGFGIVFAVVFAGLGVLGMWRGAPSAPWLLAAGAAFALLAAFVPHRLAPLNRAWTAFGLLLSRVMNPLLIGAIFFLIVTPIGLLMRALGKDPLARGLDPVADSYWITRRPPGPAPDGIRRQF